MQVGHDVPVAVGLVLLTWAGGVEVLEHLVLGVLAQPYLIYIQLILHFTMLSSLQVLYTVFYLFNL